MISDEPFPHESPPTRVTEIASIMADRGHRVVLLCTGGRIVAGYSLRRPLVNLLPKIVPISGVLRVYPPAIRLGQSNPLSKLFQGVFNMISTLLFGGFLAVSGLIQPNVIYSSTAHAQGLIASFLSGLKCVPLIVDYGDPAFVREAGIMLKINSFLERIALSRASVVVSTDPVTSRYLVVRYNRHPAFIPNGYDRSFLTDSVKASTRADRKQLITFVGKIDVSLYRFDILLEAFKQVLDKAPDTKLRLIGPGEDGGKLRNLMSRLGIDDSVEFLGFVQHRVVARLLDEAAVCVHLTNDTCLGLKVFEYMARRKPVVIASPWWHLYDDFLKNYWNCILVPLSPTDVANAMSKLLTDSGLAQTIADTAFKMIQDYTWDKVADDMLTLMKGLTHTGQPQMPILSAS